MMCAQLCQLAGRCSMLAAMFLLAAMATTSTAFYLPGVAPRAFEMGEKIALHVNRLDTTESIMPFDYYYFDFCKPGETLNGTDHGRLGAKVTENLGQVVLGERIRDGPFHLRMLKSEVCQPLCHRTYDNQNKEDYVNYKRLFLAIKRDYLNHWIVDNMPSAECTTNCRGGRTTEDLPYYRLGFPVGCAIGDEEYVMTICTRNNINNMYPNEVFINNHVDITIKYHESEEFEGYRVVGVEIAPRSLAHKDPTKPDCSPSAAPQVFKLSDPETKAEKLDFTFSYSVYYDASDIKWASRWDSYLQSSEGTRIHWFSIVNSVIIIVFLSGMLAVIFFRTLSKDISRYNMDDTEKDEIQEEFGWKLVHADVFRAPQRGMLLSVCVGTGTQLVLMSIITLTFACLGFLSPATRGGLMTAMITLWVLLGSVSGYISSRLYKTFGGEQWKKNVLLTCNLFPGVIFLVFFILNLLLWIEGSSAAVPFGTLVALTVLWFFVSLPLTFIGAYYGFKAEPIDFPLRTNEIPRQVPPQSLYTKPVPSMIMGGILPFGCIFIQLFFILNSIWSHKLYYVFGFLALVFVILAITTMESTILLCYFHLCNENYHWWWRSFLTGGAAAFYLFGYEIIFYFRRMEVDGSANLFLFVGYSFIVALLFWLITGTFGFVGCFYFVKRIYGMVKVD
eukprot:m.355098 g.355098  ORF g.355098 m.355098 type:complete len:674 (-) comp17178_c0_seq1:7542-9563(-)